MVTTMHRIWDVTRAADRSLVVTAQPYISPQLEARGFGQYTVPAGPLAEQLGAAMFRGEIWTLTLADDRETVIGARYGEGQ